MAEREYVFGQSEGETQRLIQQAQRLDLPLRRLFEDAGIGRGMRVLDLGSGAGDVALTVARLVGDGGSVVGVDQNPTVLETARERVHVAGHTNVTFVVGNLEQDLDLDGEFDAVVGRYVLMYVRKPAATLQAALRHLRPGGIVAFVETNQASPSSRDRAFPPSPLWERLTEWRTQAVARTGADVMMGWKLYQTFLDAGLPAPQIRGHMSIYDGNHPWLTGFRTGGFQSLRPIMIEHGIATEAELNLDAIAEQLQAEFLADRRIASLNLNIDAWARKP